MTALAWPIVVLVLGLCAARVAWEHVSVHRRRLRDVSAAVSAERSRVDMLAGFLDSERDRREAAERRVEALESWRVKLKNTGQVRD